MIEYHLYPRLVVADLEMETGDVPAAPAVKPVRERGGSGAEPRSDRGPSVSLVSRTPQCRTQNPASVSSGGPANPAATAAEAQRAASFLFSSFLLISLSPHPQFRPKMALLPTRLSAAPTGLQREERPRRLRERHGGSVSAEQSAECGAALQGEGRRRRRERCCVCSVVPSHRAGEAAHDAQAQAPHSATKQHQNDAKKTREEAAQRPRPQQANSAMLVVCALPARLLSGDHQHDAVPHRGPEAVEELPG